MLRDDQGSAVFSCEVAPNNTLIVSTCEPTIFEKIEEVKKTFDVDRMEIRYLPLKNSQAATIAELLSNIYAAEETVLPEELQRIRRTRTFEAGSDEGITGSPDGVLSMGLADPGLRELLSGAITPLAQGEITIIPDTEHNALLIRTFSRNFPKLLELIDKLDEPRRQVFLDVFITEVTLDDATELGVDFTYIGDIEHRSRQYTLAQNMGTALSSSGLSYQLVSDNITSFIRAMQTTDKLDIITRPQLVTKDNATGVIELGRMVPIIKTTTVSTEGATSSKVEYKDVTTRLEFTPRIHPDDYVSLQIKQKIDDVGAETFQISQDFNPQVLIKRNAETELRIKDGQTVCLGGFIADNIVEDSTKVPLLGDIPILGYLFSYTSHSRVKTELIIFITPHILTTPQEMMRMTNEQRRRSNADQRKDRDAGSLEQQRQLRYPPYKNPPTQVPVTSERDRVMPESWPAETSPAPDETDSKE